MVSLDLGQIGQHVDIPETARLLLAAPEKQMTLHLSIRTGPDEVLT